MLVEVLLLWGSLKLGPTFVEIPADLLNSEEWIQRQYACTEAIRGAQGLLFPGFIRGNEFECQILRTYRRGEEGENG